MKDTRKHHTYHPNGTVATTKFMKAGVFHRLDGPALICFHQDGSLHHKAWYLDGVLHCENGPAKVFYHEDGSVSFESWWMNGKELGKDEVLARNRSIIIDKMTCDEKDQA